MNAKTAELARLIENMTPDSPVLDLRGYQLETLPENIGTLTHLTKINLNGNRLTSLPESIGNLTNLTELYLNGHKLITLPESIGKLTNLTRLDLNGDRLESLPDSIANLTKLTELNLNGNRLNRIPDFLFGLPNLKKINLDGNPLTDISNLNNISELKIYRSDTRSKFKLIKQKVNIKIFIGDVYLDRILLDLTSFTNLLSVSLNGYGINILENGDPLPSLPPEAIEKILSDLSKIPKLSFINWHIDLFTYSSIIKSISNLDCISFLGISLGSIKQYNTRKFVITSVFHVSIQENRWTDLSILRKLPNLKGVYLNCASLPYRYWTKFSEWKSEWLIDESNLKIRQAIVKKAGFDIDLLIDAIDKQVSCLDLSGLLLNKLPINIIDFVNLQKLKLSGNRLRCLPDSLKNLSHLNNINLNNNPLKDLSILQECPRLQSVHFLVQNLPRRYWIKFSDWKPEWLLDEDNISIKNAIFKQLGYDLKPVIKYITVNRLSNADLSWLDLESLPDCIGEALNVEKLDLSCNKLTVLPQEIGNLINLTELKLSGSYSSDINEIKLIKLPDNIGNLKSLEKIELKNNAITTIPDNIGNLKSLTELGLSNNKITEMPCTIGSLNKLLRFDLDRNKLNNITDAIGNLKNLEILVLSNNQLKNIPDTIGCLTQLRTLMLDNNQLTCLPDSISNLNNLRLLRLDDNPIVDLSILTKVRNLETVCFANVHLSRRYWTKFSDWKPEWLLDEDNAETRRMLIEQVGYEKICEALKAVKVDSWREYTLLRIDNLQPVFGRSSAPLSREPIALLKMTCPSTEHIHILRVPPDMTSAEDAIVWVNHGIHPDRFAIQT